MDPPLPSRRRFLKTAFLGAAGGAATLWGASRVRAWTVPAEILALEEAVETGRARPLRRVEEFLAQPWDETPPALTRRLPQLHPDHPGGGLKLLAGRQPSLPGALEDLVPRGEPGNGVFTHRGLPGATLLPWVSLFRRTARLEVAPPALGRKVDCRLLVLKDDGSSEFPVYGNKARKYEFLLPNLTWRGVRRVGTMGSFGSNHALQLCAANRLAPLHPDRRPPGLEVELSLYPQAIREGVRMKLEVMKGLGARIDLLEDEYQAAEAFARAAAAREGFGNRGGDFAWIPPGGSNELSALGHLNALAELDEEIRAGLSELRTFPDFLFLPLGSGSTVLGVLLGLQLLGWPTKVVAVASQDRGALARLAAGGSFDRPFALGHLQRLGRSTLRWLEEAGFPHRFPDLEDLLERSLVFDNEAWRPAYGVLSEEAAALAREAGQAGLELDDTFGAKAFSALVRFSRRGELAGRTVLFWNTCNRFDYASLLG